MDKQAFTDTKVIADAIWKFAQKSPLPATVDAVCNLRSIPRSKVGFISFSDIDIHKLHPASEIVVERLKDVLFNRLLFANRLANGSILGFSSRRCFDKGAKYLHKSVHCDIPTSLLLYGLDSCPKKAEHSIWVVEGITDAIAIQTIGLWGVAALTANLTFEQAAVIAAIAPRVILCFDADASGREGTIRAAKQLAVFGVVPEIYLPALLMDPAETVAAGEAFTPTPLLPFIESVGGKEVLQQYKDACLGNILEQDNS